MQKITSKRKFRPTSTDQMRETSILGEVGFEISNTELLNPFLMQLITSCDLWAFIGSNGGVTAGRQNPDHALFPYVTQDKLFDTSGVSGSFTVVQGINPESGSIRNWIPYDISANLPATITRSVSKSVSGSKITLQEIHHDMGLSVSITWTTSDKHGIIRRVELTNLTESDLSLRVLDGMRHIMTPGVDQKFQMEFSNLTDAYKKNEFHPPCLASYSLSSIPTDKAEPNECLRATSIWSIGFPIRSHLLSEGQIRQFCFGDEIVNENEICGKRGCYLLEGEITIPANDSRIWWMAADVEQSPAKITKLLEQLQDPGSLEESLTDSIQKTTQKINLLVNQVDGLQSTALHRVGYRHFSNALFNMMRGGTFPKEYQIPKTDLLAHVLVCNADLHACHCEWMQELPELINLYELQEVVSSKKNRDLTRIISEYLPLSFSRRHGDPSRPWNRFNIEVEDEFGNERYSYQGNWRDIFQNWEALLLSFPHFTDSVISRFLNTTTADGYNPYRVTRQGFEWEKEDPNSPWSNIGYWGDHQIVYLLKLLELSIRFEPEHLANSLHVERYAFARVPYRIAPFEQILRNPRLTIEYDHKQAAEIHELVKEMGTDGQLLHHDGEVVYASLLEKLLIPLLAKLSNYIPGAGIWMNTQRPEWNDANNALTGYGASVVTLGYMARYLRMLQKLIRSSDRSQFLLHKETVNFFKGIVSAFDIDPESSVQDDAIRAQTVKFLGIAGTTFREGYYDRGLGNEKETLASDHLIAALGRVEKSIEITLRSNEREDKLFHAYNLLHFQGCESISIERLTLMLEGQVSILSSGVLGFEESDKLLSALEKSALYREDQNSYLLYPDRTLPGILEKGIISDSLLTKSRLLSDHLNSGNTQIIEKGVDGKVRFRGSFHNTHCLETQLEALGIPPDERASIGEIYEETFNHHAFTGRSGTFFSYEGLGSIYWHMVSKLLLAVQECAIEAKRMNADPRICTSLARHYHNIQNGIGVDKSPAEYGAFPTDPYSHTPSHSGAQQPGMTGQAKEDVINRIGELGIIIESGCLSFDPVLLRKEEFSPEAAQMDYYASAENVRSIPIPRHALGFTLCHTPVIYRLEDVKEVEIFLKYKDRMVARTSHRLNQEESKSIFSRTGAIQQIEVIFPFARFK